MLTLGILGFQAPNCSSVIGQRARARSGHSISHIQISKGVRERVQVCTAFRLVSVWLAGGGEKAGKPTPCSQQLHLLLRGEILLDKRRTGNGNKACL